MDMRDSRSVNGAREGKSIPRHHPHPVYIPSLIEYALLLLLLLLFRNLRRFKCCFRIQEIDTLFQSYNIFVKFSKSIICQVWPIKIPIFLNQAFNFFSLQNLKIEKRTTRTLLFPNSLSRLLGYQVLILYEICIHQCINKLTQFLLKKIKKYACRICKC